MKEESQPLLSNDPKDEPLLSNPQEDRESDKDSDIEPSQENYGEPTIRAKSPLEIAAILSTAFAYGCILTTFFLITLPVECQRIQREHPTIPKSVALGMFVAVAGVTQLVSPLAGRLSDTYFPPVEDLGQRLPYLVLGTIMTVLGLLGQSFASYWSIWIRYGFAFFLHMIGLNLIYSMMIALIPDQVPESQTGLANGTLALLLVTGSLSGFGLFHTVLGEKVRYMYWLYICIVIFTSILTCTYAHPGDVEHAQRRKQEWGYIPPSPPPTLTPMLLLRTMLYDPLCDMGWTTLGHSYTIDLNKYHDFFVVTVSRTFYYMGISIQTFFLYFLHDIIHIHKNPEGAVATLAILGQCSGAITCYPIGLASDRLLGGRRRPLVYLACAILAVATLSLMTCSSITQVSIVSLVLGGANGMYLTMETSLAVDTLPSEDKDDDDEASSGHAQLLGIWGVAGFIGSALGPLIGGPLLYAFGHQNQSANANDNATEEEYSLRGYIVILSMSAIYFFCSALSLQFIKNRNV